MNASRLFAALALVAMMPASAPIAAPTKPASGFSVPWIADDYTRALAEARARRVPLFIEAWAPW